MRKRGARWLILVAAFVFLGAAAAMHLRSICLVSDADWRDENFKLTMDMDLGIFAVFFTDYRDQFDLVLKRFQSHLKEGKNLSYNILVVENDGTVLYRLNDSFFASDRAAFLSLDGTAVLVGPESHRSLWLQAERLDERLQTAEGVGDAAVRAAFQGDPKSSGAARQGDAAGLYVIGDAVPNGAGSDTYVFWLFDGNTKAYREGTHMAPERSAAEAMKTLSIAAMAIFCLLLPLWVYLDARGRDRHPLGWAALALAGNAPGLMVYLLFRSQRFARPWTGLAALLCLPAAAAACLLALRFLPDRQEHAAQRLRAQDEVFFLNTAYTLQYTPGGADGALKSSGCNLLRTVSDYCNYIDLVYLSAEGEPLAMNGDPYFPFASGRTFIRWDGPYAYLVSGSNSMTAQRFDVTTYDSSHPSGGASAKGTVGIPFNEASEALASSVPDGRQSVGKMRIYLTYGNMKVGAALVELIITGLGSPPEPTVAAYGTRRDEWQTEARGMLGAAVPALFISCGLLLPLWVYLDARRRGGRPGRWAALVLPANIAGLAVYLCARAAADRRRLRRACPRCGGEARIDHPFCPWCAAALPEGAGNLRLPQEQPSPGPEGTTPAPEPETTDEQPPAPPTDQLEPKHQTGPERPEPTEEKQPELPTFFM